MSQDKAAQLLAIALKGGMFDFRDLRVDVRIDERNVLYVDVEGITVLRVHEAEVHISDERKQSQ